MAEKLIKVENDNWWLGVLAGFAVALFGIVALFWPGLTMLTFVMLFGLFVLVSGVIALVRGFTDLSRGRSMWWLQLLYGIAAIGIGVYLMRHQGVTYATLVLLLGFTFIIQGVVDLVRGLFGNMAYATGRALALIAGVLGIVAGVFVFSQPEASGIAFVWIVGLYALILGPLMIAAGIDERPESK